MTRTGPSREFINVVFLAHDRPETARLNKISVSPRRKVCRAGLNSSNSISSTADTTSLPLRVLRLAPWATALAVAVQYSTKTDAALEMARRTSFATIIPGGICGKKANVPHSAIFYFLRSHRNKLQKLLLQSKLQNHDHMLVLLAQGECLLLRTIKYVE